MFTAYHISHARMLKGESETFIDSWRQNQNKSREVGWMFGASLRARIPNTPLQIGDMAILGNRYSTSDKGIKHKYVKR